MTTSPRMFPLCRKFQSVITRFSLCSSAIICGAFALFIFLSAATHTSAQEKVDLLITGGTVITMDAQRRVLEDGAITTRADSIVAVGARTALEAKYAAAKALNARG